MAINMELMLFLHICFLITIHCFTPEEHIMSTENINEILDKLILQTHPINDSGPTADIKDLTSVDETQPGIPSNDSDIYYFKTIMDPHINFKSSSEIHVTRNSNKTLQSHEVSNDDHDTNSEDKPFPDAGKITRKSSLVTTNKKEFKVRAVGKSGNVNDYSLEDFIKKEIELSTPNDNKQISFTQSAGHQNQQLRLLHEFPEIIIDQITYDNDKEDNNKLLKKKPIPVTQHVENVVKGEINSKVPLVQRQKIRYNIPEEEEFEVTDQYHDTPENFGPRNYLTPEVKGLLEAIIHKKVMHEALLKQTTESESRKQSFLLEKILQRLPEIRPAEMETLSHIRSSLNTLRRNGGSHLTNSYLNVPYVPSKWEIHNRLLRILTHLFRPDVLKHTRLVAGLIDRIVPNIGYQPEYYDLYKK